MTNGKPQIKIILTKFLKENPLARITTNSDPVAKLENDQREPMRVARGITS
jgi:hypothetical protein